MVDDEEPFTFMEDDVFSVPRWLQDLPSPVTVASSKEGGDGGSIPGRVPFGRLALIDVTHWHGLYEFPANAFASAIETGLIRILSVPLLLSSETNSSHQFNPVQDILKKYRAKEIDGSC